MHCTKKLHIYTDMCQINIAIKACNTLHAQFFCLHTWLLIKAERMWCLYNQWLEVVKVNNERKIFWIVLDSCIFLFDVAKKALMKLLIKIRAEKVGSWVAIVPVFSQFCGRHLSNVYSSVCCCLLSSFFHSIHWFFLSFFFVYNSLKKGLLTIVVTLVVMY